MELTEGQLRYRKYRQTYAKYQQSHKHVKYPTQKYKDTLLFGGNRIKALERDGYRCKKCGMTNQEHKNKWGRELTVDHIDGKGRYSEEQNNNLENLSTLCLSCHGRKDVARRADRQHVQPELIK
jgi:5-methylcytosine-specific restriction endonuclease McrA